MAKKDEKKVEPHEEVFGWESTIEVDDSSFVVLEEGDYTFEVKNFERGSFPGGTKIPACPKAILTLAVKTSDGTAIIHTDLLLCKQLEWKLAAFFRSIGLKKHGEKLIMDWNKVQGRLGIAHFKPREFFDKNGNSHITNGLSKFIDWDEKYVDSISIDNNSDDDDELPF